MTDPVTILSAITLASTIVSPLVIAIAYGIRKIRKSSCMSCCACESDDKTPSSPMLK